MTAVHDLRSRNVGVRAIPRAVLVATRRSGALAAAVIALVTILASATPSPAASGGEAGVLLPLGAEVATSHDGRRMTLRLVETRIRGEDCQDCPNSAVVEVIADGSAAILKYSISGNMQLEAKAKARRKTAHGLVFVIEGIQRDKARIVIVEEKP